MAQWGVRQLVVDPVMVATSGDYLADESAGRAILELLLPLATIVTPNIPEAEALLGAPRGRCAQQRRRRRAQGSGGRAGAVLALLLRPGAALVRPAQLPFPPLLLPLPLAASAPRWT